MIGMITFMVMVLANLAMDSMQVDARKMTIAAVFDEGGDRRHELAFRHAVQAINRNRYEGILAYMLQNVAECKVVSINRKFSCLRGQTCERDFLLGVL